MLRSHTPPGSVTLSGWDPRIGYPLWFGFITAGQWGPPARVVPSFTLDPANPSVPAGCYVLSTTWPGGAWRVAVSTGAISDTG